MAAECGSLTQVTCRSARSVVGFSMVLPLAAIAAKAMSIEAGFTEPRADWQA